MKRKILVYLHGYCTVDVAAAAAAVVIMMLSVVKMHEFPIMRRKIYPGYFLSILNGV